MEAGNGARKGHLRQLAAFYRFDFTTSRPNFCNPFFRFGKQKLLLTDYQTPETAHEERWWQLAHLAYLQLWVARETATCRPRPWERSLPNHKSGKSTPTLVQRAFAQFIAQFGTPAKAPKPRGKSPGRRKGVRLVARQRQKVLKKDELPPV